MKSPLLIPVLLALPVGLSAAAQSPSEAGAAKVAPVARVGTLPITRSDLDKERNRLIPMTFFHSRVPEGRVAEFEREALDNLIERALIFLDAGERGLTVTEDELRSEFRETLAKSGPQFQDVPDEEFARLLETYRQLVTRRVLLDKNEARFDASLPVLDDKALHAAYEERRADMLTPEEVRFRHILIRVEPSASSAEAKQAFERTEGLVAELGTGASFEELAQSNSDDIFAELGGDLGFVSRGAFMNGAIDEAAFGLLDGETSGALTSIHGFHVVRRVETKPRRQLNFEEASGFLRETLEVELRARERARWLATLREHYGVEVLLPLPAPSEG